MNNRSVRVRLTRLGIVMALSAASMLAGGASRAVADVTRLAIQGDGSSWAAPAINQWIADVNSRGLKVDYTSAGSAQGRTDFASSLNDFAGSDIGYQGNDSRDGTGDASPNRPYAYLPLAAGGTAFPYTIIQGGRRVTNLRLSPATLLGIFTGKITNWNDAAVTADNNGHALSSKTIVPVVHSEGAGSTAQFTAFLAATNPTAWNAYLASQSLPPSKMTEYFPSSGNMYPASGSDGTINYITSSSGDGSIGYDEYSYALGKNLPVAKVLNKAGIFTLPTQFNDAVALQAAIINEDPNSQDYLLQDLHNVYTNPAPQTYPVSSYSYAIIPTSASDARMRTGKRQTLADFLAYAICDGQSELGPTGYSSLPLNLVQGGFKQIQRLHDADPAVTTSATPPTTCKNPTFDPTNYSVNKLATLAPDPPDCDKVGQGPCNDDTSTGAANKSAKTKETAGAAAKKSTTTKKATTSGATAGAGAGAAATGPGTQGVAAVDAATEQSTGEESEGTDSSDSGDSAVASPVDLAASSRTGSRVPYAVLAVVMLLIAVLAPPFVLRRLQSGKG